MKDCGLASNDVFYLLLSLLEKWLKSFSSANALERSYIKIACEVDAIELE